TFRLNANETLSSDQLGPWVDALDTAIPGTVTVLMDACHSGSFLPALSSWGLAKSLGEKSVPQRIVMTSTKPPESAYFVNVGSISFSNYFWSGIFNGDSVGEAYTNATNAMQQTFGQASNSPNVTSQTPQIDVNGNALSEAGEAASANSVHIG